MKETQTNTKHVKDSLDKRTIVCLLYLLYLLKQFEK